MKTTFKKAVAMTVASAIAVCALGLTAFAEQPTTLGATAKVEYLYDAQGKKIGVKSVTIDGMFYYDINGGVKFPDNISDKELYYKAINNSGTQKPIDYWSQVAYAILKDNYEYTAYGYGNKNAAEFDKANGMNENNRWPDLVNDFQKTASGERGDSKAKVRYTGVNRANSLNEVRTKMASELVAAGVPGTTNDLIKFCGGDDCLKPLNDSKTQPVIYSIVTSLDFIPSSPDQYQSYGLAFYNFRLTPVNDDGLDFITAADGYKTVEDAAKNNVPGVSYKYTPEKVDPKTYTNDSTVELVQDTSRSVSKSDTMENSLSTTTAYKYTESLSASISAGFLKIFKATLTAGFSAEQLFQFEKGTKTSQTITTTDTISASATMPPHTGVVVELSTGEIEETVKYNCPMAITYDVAVFSMAGTLPGLMTKHFCTTLGSKNENATQALKNQNANTFAQVRMSNNAVTMKSLNWNSIANQAVVSKARATQSYSTLKQWLTTNTPMSAFGATMKSTSKTHNLTQKDLYALYPLKEVMFTDVNAFNVESAPYQVKEYERKVGETLSLDSAALRLKGYNGRVEQEKHILYYGFDPSYGQWWLTDKDGNLIETTQTIKGDNVITESDNAKLTYNMKTCQITLETKKAGDVYLKYQIHENVYQTPQQSRATKNSDLNKTAFIHVTVADIPHEGTIQATGSITGNVGDVVDLNSNTCGVKASVYDKTGKEIAVDKATIKWEQKNLNGLSIDENNQMTMLEEGNYEIRACYKEIYSNWVPVTVKKVQEEQIQTINISVTAPKAGETPDLKATTKDVGYTCNDIAWNPKDKVFENNTEYTANIVLKAAEGYAFADNLQVKVNGETARLIGKKTPTAITLTYTFNKTEALKMLADEPEFDITVNPNSEPEFELELDVELEPEA
ncbi:MAG: hypothetical protein FWH05_05940 [Oscillospiraceae bacterium]|nr:hypothetical protein [Oscillospiraceae bacterium]